MARVYGSRLGAVWLSALDGTAQVLVQVGINSNAVTENVVKYGASEPPYEPDMKGGISTPTPVRWWTGLKLFPPLVA